jgi:hypothetical protein
MTGVIAASPHFSPGGGRTTYCIECGANIVDLEKTVCFREVPIPALAGSRARAGSRERSPNGDGARGRGSTRAWWSRCVALGHASPAPASGIPVRNAG